MIKRTNNYSKGYTLLFILHFAFGIAQNNITYNEFIQSIKTNFPLAKVADNTTKQGDYLINSARGNYDPAIQATYENKFFNGKNYFSVAHAELKQPIFTNQYLSAGWDYGQGNFIDGSDITGLNGTAFLGIESSLLQGLLLDKRRAEVLKARGYKEYYEAERKQLFNQILFEASLYFTEFAFAEKELLLYEYFMKLANDRYTALKELSKAGERAAVDTIEASLLYQGRLLEYNAASIDNQKALNKLLNFSWKDELTPSAYDTSIILKDSLEFYFDQAKKSIALELNSDTVINPIIQKYLATQQILTVEKRWRAELIKPKLDVKYNFLSSNRSPYTGDYSINNYKWGAKFSMPLFLRTSINEYKIAKLKLQNNQFELANKTNEIELKIRVIKQNISIVARQIVAAEKNVLFSKQLLQAEKLKFENGESSLFLLNTRETKWLESELKLAEYRTKFIRLYFELVYIKGDIKYQL